MQNPRLISPEPAPEQSLPCFPQRNHEMHLLKILENLSSDNSRLLFHRSYLNGLLVLMPSRLEKPRKLWKLQRSCSGLLDLLLDHSFARRKGIEIPSQVRKVI